MKLLRALPLAIVLSLLLAGVSAQAATITGTVTNKTDGKPAAGDTVVLVDVQAGMADAATTKTDAHGHYSLETPGAGAYLIRVTHQGAPYFIAAPQGNTPGDLSVYDAAPKVDGVGIDGDMILAEAAGNMLRVQEHYLVRNTSLPPKAQYSSNTFEIVIPADAVLDTASANRPGRMATNIKPVPLEKKGHYTFNLPIEPGEGEKETMFAVEYHLPYNGKYTFTPQLLMPANSLEVYLPKGMTFANAQGASFQTVQQDPRVQTFVARGPQPGQTISFTVSGEGQMPREAQSGGGGGPQASGGMGDTSDAGNRPGGGIGNPIGTPDPLTKYKWWILAGLALLLAAAAAFLLRRQNTLGASAMEAGGSVSTPAIRAQQPSYSPSYSTAPVIAAPAVPPAGNAALLNMLRDELFAIESERISGTMTQAEYSVVKTGLEALLKRALAKK
jgi:hypothetical protein